MAIKFKKIVSFLCLVSLLMMISIPNASATSNGIVLTVSNVTAQAGTEVEVPVILSQNTSGVLAMQLSMSYDSRLAFKSIKQGDALTTLNLTPLKDFSANPCTILLDGLDADVSNGTILILTFAVPSGAAGDYDVSLSYNVGEVYDDDMNDIDVTIVNGGISVVTSEPEVSNGIVLTVSDVTAQAGTEVEVPVILSQNTSGVLAMQLSMYYDSRLVFKSIKQGDALSTLNLTPIKDFSANPCTILLDGLDAEVSNGTILVLTFAVPADATGNFDVGLSYNVGEIYDNDMNDIDVTIVNGGIKVETSQPEVTEPTLEVGECTKGTNTVSFDVFAKSPDELTGKIIVASYKFEGAMDKVKIYPAASKVSVTVDTATAKYIKVMWWNMSSIEPFTKHIKININ